MSSSSMFGRLTAAVKRMVDDDGDKIEHEHDNERDQQSPVNFQARQSPLSGGTMKLIYYITLE
jgi:hypothetical protein